MSVSAGALGGGTSTTITGTGFLSGATVSFGGSAGTSVSVVNATTITVTSPAHSAGAVNVVVTNSDSQSGTLTNGYTYQAAPTITSLNVSAGALGGGTSLTIDGAGFLAGAGVTFGGVSGTSIFVVDSTTITVTTPAHSAGAVDVVVTNTDSQSSTLTNGYTYQAAPTVTSLSVSSGSNGGGTSTTITGTGFVSGATVTFGGSSGTSVSVVNSTTITVSTPSHSAGAVNVVVTNADSQSGTLTNGYTYIASSHSAFVTSNAYTGNLGGLYGADFYCQKEAHDLGVNGVWKAILSGPTNANSRISITADILDTSAVQHSVASDSTAFWNNTYTFPIGYSLDGVSAGGADVWTGSSSAGNSYAAGTTCAGWTSSSGSSFGEQGRVVLIQVA